MALFLYKAVYSTFFFTAMYPARSLSVRSGLYVCPAVYGTNSNGNFHSYESCMVQKVSQLCNKEFTEDAKQIHRPFSHLYKQKGKVVER